MRSLACFLVLVCVLAGIPSQFPPGEWYHTLAKPNWTPPPWVFPVAWIPLYLAIAVAGWRLWLAEASATRTVSLWLWSIQLVCNCLWSPLFFGLHHLTAALGVCLALLASIAACIGWFRQVSLVAMWLFVPYGLWVAFATALNAAIVACN
jgi:benzodiazapine receptor